MNYFRTFALFFMLSSFGIQACKNHQNHSSVKDVQYKKHGIDTSEGVPTGLHVGDLAPIFSYRVNGASYDLKTDLEKGPVLIMFYRGYWCPVCNRYLKTIEDSLSMVRKRGVKLLAISPQLDQYTTETREQSGTSLDLISDTNRSIMNAYNVSFRSTDAYQMKIQLGLLKNISEANGGSEDLPVPATFLIDQNQRIVYRHFNPDYHNRASIKSVIAVIDSLNLVR